MPAFRVYSRDHMLAHLAKISITALCMMSIIVQTLSGSLGTGGILCLGCDRGGWTIRASTASTTVAGCCDEEQEHATSDGCTDSAEHFVHSKKHCGCIGVPLICGSTMATASPEAGTSHEVAKVFAIMALPIANSELPCSWAHWSRAGPRTQSRPFVPSSRCIVLVI